MIPIEHTKHLLIATAGHVDHGKSSLVQGLTGTDPDRWQEEKDRGITIDLGYANCSRDDITYSFVDVPGHERFIHNMLAGIGSIDAALLIIAADEAVMPQTKEHALALHFLQVPQVGIIVTKCDLVDDDFLELVHSELDDWLPNFGWQDAPRANVSIKHPQSLEKVFQLLGHFEPKIAHQSGIFRLPIDRVFTSSGSGTVVTGTVVAGHLNKQETLTVMPQNHTSRIRQMQHHSKQVETISRHQRVAINLVDLHHAELKRGQTLFSSPAPEPTQQVLVRLTAFCDWQPMGKHLFHLHHLTTHLMARCVWQEGNIAMLKLEQPHYFWALDRGLIRDLSPLQVVAGFEVLDPQPTSTRRKHFKTGLSNWATVATITHWQTAFIQTSATPLTQNDLLKTTGITVNLEEQAEVQFLDDERFISRPIFLQLLHRCLDCLDHCHRELPFYQQLPLTLVMSKWLPFLPQPNIAEELLKVAIETNKVLVNQDRIQLVGFEVAWSNENKTLLYQILSKMNSRFPVLDLRDFKQDAKTKELIDMLVWEKYLITLTPQLLTPSETLNILVTDLAKRFYGQSLQIADLKDLLGISRKVAIPLLEWFDKSGLTLRQAEGRKWLAEKPQPIVCNWLAP